MIREHLIEKELGHEKDFHWRGGEVSRIEGFSDAVFAFAITLLVVSLEVPNSFDKLMNLVYGFPAFSATFAAIVSIWYAHYLFFRRYGLQDSITIILNALLLFVVIFYLYPLKFLATLLISYGLMYRLFGFNIQVDISMGNQENWSNLMIIYGFGFLAIFLIFIIMHIRAYRKRDELKLNEIETFATRTTINAYGICVITAIISLTMVIAGGGRFWTPLSGWIYALIGPVQAIHGIWAGKKGEKLKREIGLRN